VNIKIEKYGYFNLDNELNVLTPQRNTTLYEVEFITRANGFNYSNKKEYPILPNRLIFYPIGVRRYARGGFGCWYVHFSCSDVFVNSCLPAKRKSVIVADPQVLTSSFQSIVKKMIAGSSADVLAALSALLYIISHFAEGACADDGNSLNSESTFTKLELAKNFIDLNFKNISWKMAADHIGYSHTYFHNLFKKYFLQTPHEYIIGLKINLSKKLLITTNYTVPQVAEESGFNNFTYFSYLFKKKTTVSPLTFRKTYLP
jgi:AraC-like DNA-binding protein